MDPKKRERYMRGPQDFIDNYSEKEMKETFEPFELDKIIHKDLDKVSMIQDNFKAYIYNAKLNNDFFADHNNEF